VVFIDKIWKKFKLKWDLGVKFGEKYILLYCN
jgi:hypothetical protein